MLIKREDFWERWLIDIKSILIKKIAILPRVVTPSAADMSGQLIDHKFRIFDQEPRK